MLQSAQLLFICFGDPPSFASIQQQNDLGLENVVLSLVDELTVPPDCVPINSFCNLARLVTKCFCSCTHYLLF